MFILKEFRKAVLVLFSKKSLSFILFLPIIFSLSLQVVRVWKNCSHFIKGFPEFRISITLLPGYFFTIHIAVSVPSQDFQNFSHAFPSYSIL